MVGQQGIRYTISLITAHFGDVVAKVCECLIRRGPLCFMEVVRFTELHQGQVKDCLLVLIQHNCVQAFSIPKTVGMGGATKPVTLYMAIFDNIIHRMRFSKFLLIVKEHLGNQSGEETWTIEKEAIIAAAPLDADRFSGILDLMMDTEADIKHIKKDSSLEVSAGNKRKHEVLVAEEEIQNTINTIDVLWRANYEKFVQCLKKKTCVANVKSRFGLEAAIVLEAMIGSSDHQNARTMNSAFKHRCTEGGKTEEGSTYVRVISLEVG